MSALADELGYASACRLAELIKSRQLSPVEVVRACLQRIEARNPSLNAFVLVDHEHALAAARNAERALLDGEPLGPLHGVPTALKDLYDSRTGWVTTFGGLPSLRGFVADRHCQYAERMERAGAILVGKTNSPVLGLRAVCDNPLFGPTSNPFDVTRNAGGSSGGSAAAVADGLLPLAEGTDAAGSIRIPAAWCGVFGLYPSPGRIPNVSRPNAFAATSPFRSEGPITRSVADAALAMSVLSGYHPSDPFSLREEVDFVRALDRDLAGFRIAYSPDLDVFPVDRRIAAVVDRAVTAFEDAGARVDTVALGLRRDHRELSDLWFRLMMPGAHATLERLTLAGYDLLGSHRDELPAEIRGWLEATADLTARDAARDQEMRTEVYDAIQAVFNDHDLLVCPTVAALPVPNGAGGSTLGPAVVDGTPVDPAIGWCLTFLTNLSGHPAASVPAGFVDGLPVGMQIIGPRRGDSDVLAASAAFERLRPWADGYRRCRERPVTAAE